MLKIEKFVTASPEQWKIIIEGMRNPMNSWGKMDSYTTYEVDTDDVLIDEVFNMGENDRSLMMNLAKNGPVHAKYRRMIPVYLTLTAPLYWWKEADKYQVGTVTNSCSTMHKIQAKEFTLEDFSYEHLNLISKDYLLDVIRQLNACRNDFLSTKDKRHWWQMIQLLPSSYNQKRTWFLNYEVLANIYLSRRGHRLDEWKTLLDWIEELPYSEIITGETE